VTTFLPPTTRNAATHFSLRPIPWYLTGRCLACTHPPFEGDPSHDHLPALCSTHAHLLVSYARQQGSRTARRIHLRLYGPYRRIHLALEGLGRPAETGDTVGLDETVERIHDPTVTHPTTTFLAFVIPVLLGLQTTRSMDLKHPDEFIMHWLVMTGVFRLVWMGLAGIQKRAMLLVQAIPPLQRVAEAVERIKYPTGTDRMIYFFVYVIPVLLSLDVTRRVDLQHPEEYILVSVGTAWILT
jgi:hypothetical protein